MFENNSDSNEDYNMIFMACYYDDFELLDSYIELNHGLLVKNRFNNTPLHIAVQHSSFSIL